MKLLFGVSAIALASVSSSASAWGGPPLWSGTVTMYDSSKFAGRDYLFHVNQTQTCYNVGKCYDDTATSIKWSGLPTQGSFNGDAWIFFYENPDCNKNTMGDWWAGSRGKMRGWKVSEPYKPEDLGFDKFDNLISSFMIWESSGTPVRYTSACWEGA